MESYRAVPGTRDILPQERKLWQRLESVVREVMSLYAYEEIVTPAFEHTALFARSIGEHTDIVSKEMYTFEDMGKRSLTLRPEGTAGVIRAYLEHSMGKERPVNKLWYTGPLFRQERPQKGRQRQFHQFGVEAIGPEGPQIDAEVIAILLAVLRGVEVDGVLHLSSIGDPNCRPAYIEKLTDYLKGCKNDLDPLSQERITTNALRVLDSKDTSTQAAIADAPHMLDFLCGGCQAHFDGLKETLTSMRIDYVVDPTLVRGLDYYTKTVFEVRTDQLGSQNALGGGGRYDGLVEELGGAHTPAVGFAAGMERLTLLMSEEGLNEGRLDVYVATLGERARAHAPKILEELRKNGLKSDSDNLGRSLKAQLRAANRADAKVAVVLGDDELEQGVAQVKFMDSKEQKDVPLEGLTELLKSHVANEHTAAEASGKR